MPIQSPRKQALAAALAITLALLAAPLAAASLGSLRMLSATAATATAAPGWDIVTSNGSRLRIEVLRSDVIHVQAGRNGVSGFAAGKSQDCHAGLRVRAGQVAVGVGRLVVRLPSQ